MNFSQCIDSLIKTNGVNGDKPVKVIKDLTEFRDKHPSLYSRSVQDIVSCSVPGTLIDNSLLPIGAPYIYLFVKQRVAVIGMYKKELANRCTVCFNCNDNKCIKYIADRRMTSIIKPVLNSLRDLNQGTEHNKGSSYWYSQDSMEYKTPWNMPWLTTNLWFTEIGISCGSKFIMSLMIPELIDGFSVWQPIDLWDMTIYNNTIGIHRNDRSIDGHTYSMKDRQGKIINHIENRIHVSTIVNSIIDLPLMSSYIRKTSDVPYSHSHCPLGA